jgi:hypothetical protein
MSSGVVQKQGTFQIEIKLHSYTHTSNDSQPSYNRNEIIKCHLVLISHMTHKNSPKQIASLEKLTGTPTAQDLRAEVAALDTPFIPWPSGP